MRWIVVAAASAALGAAFGGAAHAQEAVLTNPPLKSQPTSADIDRAFPPDARPKEVSGRAVMRCKAGVDGRLGDCMVTRETPPAFGFGAALLSLAPRYQLEPKTRDGQSTAGRLVEVAQAFTIASTQTTRQSSSSKTFITEPVWNKAPGVADIARAYASLPPRSAPASLIFRCDVELAFGLSNCEVIKGPNGEGYEQAARQLLPLFELGGAKRPAGTKAYVDLVITLEPATAPGEDAYLEDPAWVQGPTPEQLKAAFPGKASADRGQAGLDCVVDATGAMKKCKVVAENPAGQGFGEAAIGLADTMRVNPWTDDGHSVEGVHVQFALPFDRKAAVAPAAKGPPGR